MRRPLACLLAFAFALTAQAQRQTPSADSLKQYDLSPVVVTATRSARALQDVPVPTTVVTREAIRLQGSLRLADLLAEQPGLALVNGVGGAGLQMQGFDPDYTLILIDGEPIVGREAGTLDLDRLTVAGVERVEIVRGPTSSRYGSDALAGVVNLITRRPESGLRGRVGARYESFETSDLALEAEGGGERWGVRLLGNRFASAGYDLQPDVPGQTTPAFTDYTGEVRLDAEPADGLRLGLRARTAHRDQDGSFALGTTQYDEAGTRREWSLAPSVGYRFSTRLRATLDTYAAGFGTWLRTVDAGAGTVFDETRFDQGYQKAEGRLTLVPGTRAVLYTGGGLIRETVESDRYARAQATLQGYGFAEFEWNASRLLDAVVSARFDRHSEFGQRFTPKVALLARPAKGVRLRASVGSGFKTPDFRQRYLNFANATAGYSVFGAAEVAERLAALDAVGALDRYLTSPALLGELRPESSVSFGAGVEVEPFALVTARVNFFRNHVNDLIETQPVAVKTNGQSVFTYFNLNRIYTQGVEADVSAHVLPALHVGASYQFLDTADRDVLDAIDDGTLFGRKDGRDVRLTRSDYGGLFGRSRHSGTLRLTHTSAWLGLTGALRLVWRGRYGYGDLNGNLVLDSEAEYVPGYALVHATFTRPFGRAQLQAGVRNLFDYTNPQREPALAGRTLFLGASVRL